MVDPHDRRIRVVSVDTIQYVRNTQDQLEKSIALKISIKNVLNTCLAIALDGSP